MMSTEMVFLLFFLWIGLSDGAKDSLLPIDFCSLCAKGNSSCRMVSGLFTKPQLPLGYNLITQLPKEACNLTISQLKRNNNFLALRRSDDSYILNGDWEIGWSGVFESAGMKFTYTREDENTLETISSAGPLQETIDLMLIYQEPNPGVKYQYQFPMLRPEAVLNTLELPVGKQFTDERPENNEIELQRHNDHFISFAMKDKLSDSVYTEEVALKAKHKLRRRKVMWKVVGFTECSKSCAGGVKTPVVLCVREYNQMPIPERRCALHQKPLVANVQCNVEPCAAHWVAGEWSECSVTCGEGLQTRDISCKQDISPGLTIPIASESCNTHPPTLLKRTRSCHQPPCINPKPLPSAWRIGPWSMCSVTCGMGLMSRTIHCPLQDCGDEHPPTQSVCDMGSCVSIHAHKTTHFWLFSEWSQKCSENCGTGVQIRKVRCSGLEHLCDEGSKPENSRNCFSDKQCNGQWYSGPWGQCSIKCGWGKQQRSIICISKSNGELAIKLESNCLSKDKPTLEQQCYSDEDCGAEWYTADWSQCIGSCESGIQTREVQCLDNNLILRNDCLEDKIPESQRSCLPNHCSQTILDNSLSGGNFEHVHFFSSFSDLSDNVIVVDRQKEDNNHTLNVNAVNVQPRNSTSVVQPNLGEIEDCEDKFHNCNLVVQARLCKYKYYYSSCCRSCGHYL